VTRDYVRGRLLKIMTSILSMVLYAPRALEDMFVGRCTQNAKCSLELWTIWPFYRVLYDNLKSQSRLGSILSFLPRIYPRAGVMHSA
jgi:hypothetical protein